MFYSLTPLIAEETKLIAEETKRAKRKENPVVKYIGEVMKMNLFFENKYGSEDRFICKVCGEAQASCSDAISCLLIDSVGVFGTDQEKESISIKCLKGLLDGFSEKSYQELLLALQQAITDIGFECYSCFGTTWDLIPEESK